MESLAETLIECVTSAGQLLRERFGKVAKVSRKESLSSIVTEADLASENCITGLIRARYPGHNIIAEESGLQWRSSDITWVVDPLDGTSNFAAGIPWFGIAMAVLRRGQPVMAAMHLPEAGLLYFSEQGRGVFRNQQPVYVTPETDLGNTLCACGLDSCPDEGRARRNVEMLIRLVNRTRNVRATNCLVDFCYTIDGRFGACVNQSTKVWDIAPGWLMLREAGGILTDLAGQEVVLSLDSHEYDRTYAVVGTSRLLLPQVLAALGEVKCFPPASASFPPGV